MKISDNINELQYILDNGELAVNKKSGRKITHRPVLLFPDGRIRIEFLGTYKSIKACYNCVRDIINNNN